MSFHRQPVTATPRNQQGVSRAWLPRLSLRKRTSDHPMVMFAVVTSAAFLSMAFMPPAGPAFASFSAPVKIDEDVRTTARLARIPFKEKDIVCRGQSWAAESDDCMRLIAEESGLDGDRKVRRLAAAAQDSSTPNIF